MSSSSASRDNNTVDLTRGGSDRRRDRDGRDRRTSSSSSSSHRPNSQSSKPHARPSSSSASSSSHRSFSHKQPPSSSHRHHHRHAAAAAALPLAADDESSLTKKTSQFQFDPVYTNTLPTPPAAPKRLLLPSSMQHLTGLCGGGLLASYRHPLYTDALLSLPINFVNTASYIAPPQPRPLSPASQAAFMSTSPSVSSLSKPSSVLLPSQQQLFRQGFSNWARKPEYTSNNLFAASNSQVALMDVRKREVEEVERRREERRQRGRARGREEQIERIERTFTQAQHIPSHPRKKHLHAVAILPVLPEPSVSGAFTWSEFDYDPQTGDATHLPTPLFDNALLLPLPASSTAPTSAQLALYLSAAAGSAPSAAAESVWRHGRDYELLPTSAVDADNNFFFLMSEDGVAYSRYGSRMRLSKRMKRGHREEADIMDTRASEVRVSWTEGGRAQPAEGAAGAEAAETERAEGERDGEKPGEQEGETAGDEGETAGETAEGEGGQMQDAEAGEAQVDEDEDTAQEATPA